MGVAGALFAIAAAAIVAVWGWLGSMVQMPPSPLASGGKLYCISYAPFRGDQNPFGPDVPIDPRQIDEDLAQLKQITDCVRTYSIDHGLDQIPEIAKRHGMKVLQGLWLSNRPDRSRYQVETAIGLAKRFPDVIVAVIVGNEVLLRGEMSGPELVRIIREVKAQVSMPVTYADVWEFWLRHREVAAAVDFISIHERSDADLTKPGPVFGEESTARRVYLRMLAHMNEHMGQMVAYTRTMGNPAPWPDWRAAAGLEPVEHS